METVESLLNQLPFSYKDRSSFFQLGVVNAAEKIIHQKFITSGWKDLLLGSPELDAFDFAFDKALLFFLKK
ncbi:hypothetical protein [Solimicrobium silvestre]|uniref:Uncharacterized protein n=1 Tax=Solimicrobium silvestre TaxID=2099400 RepID=A0A2S9GTI8_9BURK|nr:hypothetical protein [Solimicrobium silvestre]PRC91039.1 hypothetical protein S2091_4227 [Solimicrobium silvestre]